jgi:hypothetical protein
MFSGLFMFYRLVTGLNFKLLAQLEIKQTEFQSLDLQQFFILKFMNIGTKVWADKSAFRKVAISI